MAYGIKYIFTWGSPSGAAYKILILKDGYSGSSLTRRLGRAPVLSRKNSDRVYGTSLELYAECKVDQEFSELYTSNPREFKVQLQRNDAVIWTGFVSPELYSEPDIAPPYDVDIVATDGLGELKQYTFEPQGDKSLIQLFTYLLGFTGNTAQIQRISALSAKTSAGGTISDANLWGTALINIDYKAGESCYDVLQYLLTTLCACITYQDNAWLIWRSNDITAANSSYKVIGSIGGASDIWPVGQLSTKVEPAKRKVVVEAPFHQWTPLLNPEMREDAGWTKYNATYDAQANAYKMGLAGTISQTINVIDMSVGLAISTQYGSAVPTSEITGRYGELEFTPEGSSDIFVICDKNDGNGPQWFLTTEVRPIDPTKGWKHDLYITIGAQGTAPQTIIDLPAFNRQGYSQRGELVINLFGRLNTLIYNFYLYRPASRGFRDIILINNDARGDGDTVEIAQGRVTSDMVDVYFGYLRGILTYDGDKFVTTFVDSQFSTYMDYMSLIARNYARLVALPRLRITGTINTPASFAVPMILRKGSVDYILETFSWDLLNDELEIDALSLASGTLTIEDEVITDTTREQSSGGSSGSGGGGGGGGGGVSVAWGTETADHYAPLSVGGDQRNVALDGHKHVIADITDLVALIPSQASANNQLADKEFVNSSIATSTADFRGTSAQYLTYAEFIAWANGLTHNQNDYVYWWTTDGDGNTVYKRYKWDGTAWVYEYDLNNSSFTAEQWAAINSGITNALKNKLVALPSVETLNNTLDHLEDDKQDLLTFDNVPTAGSNNPVKSGGIFNRFTEIVNMIAQKATAAWGAVTNYVAKLTINGTEKEVLLKGWNPGVAGNTGLPTYAHPGGEESYKYTKGASGTEQTITEELNAGQPRKIDHIGTHPELSAPVAIPGFINDLAYFRQRGGGCKLYVNNVERTDERYAYYKDAMFNCGPGSMAFDGTHTYTPEGGSPTTYHLGLTSPNDTARISLDFTTLLDAAVQLDSTYFTTKFAYGSYLYIDFGNDWWGPRECTAIVKYGRFKRNAQGGVYDITEDTANRQTFKYTGPGDEGHLDFLRLMINSNTSYGIIGIDIVFTGFHEDTYEATVYKYKPRVSEIGVVGLSSRGPAEGLMARGADDPVYRSITPANDAAYDLGASAKRWRYAYVKRVYLSATAYLEIGQDGKAHLYRATGLVVENGDIASAG